MAEVLGGQHNHGLLSLVNRTRPALPPGMPLQPEVIVIPDDDDEVLLVNRARRDVVQQKEAGPSTRPRHDHSASPSVQRNKKRQRLNGGTDLSDDAAHIKTEFPKLHLNFETDESGAALLYPNFFDDAFILTPSPNNEEVNIVVEVSEPKEEEPPYFEDPRLLIRMFRGPGFEHFPIPFNESHKEFCDAWDAKKRDCEERRRLKQTRYNDFGPYIDHTVAINDSDVGNRAKGELSTAQKECLARIVDILPDVKRDFVVEKIKSQQESYSFADEEIEILPEAGTIISEILELDDYPKEPKPNRDSNPYEVETGKTIVWTKEHRQHREYLKDAVIALASQFDYVPTHYIYKTVQEKTTLWDAFVHVDEIDRDYFQRRDRPYLRSKRPRGQLEKKYQRNNPYRDPNYYASLVTELQAVKQHRTRQILKSEEEQRKANAEAENLERHKGEGLVVTCGCCFDEETPLNRIVACTAQVQEHSFCFSCIESLANTQIGLMRHEMLCMDGSGCKERLDMEGVGRAIPYKTFDKLLLNEQQAEIAAANLEGLEQCPYCEFRAICDPIELDSIFSCQNPDCFKVTCRKCHAISHLPKTCEDIKNERGLNARHKVEEARSAAMMRPCPSCKTNLIKELGCNKLRCQCGAVICYVCKADLSSLKDGYAHFSQTSHSNRKCALYDTPGVDRHVQEANDAEIDAINAAKKADSTIEEKTLQIETGQLGPMPQVLGERARDLNNPHLLGGIHNGNPIPANLLAIHDYQRQAERVRREAENVGMQDWANAIARQRAMMAAMDFAAVPALPAQPINHLAWPGNLVPGNPIQPGDPNVDAWRNGVQHNYVQPQFPWAARAQQVVEQRIPVQDHNHGYHQRRNVEDFEPMNLDFDDDQGREPGNNNFAPIRRMNEPQNDDRRRRAPHPRRHSNRDGVLLRREHAPHLPYLYRDQQDGAAGDQNQPIQQHAYPQNVRQIDLQLDQQLAGLGRENDQLRRRLNADVWRAQYRPPTPIPARKQNPEADKVVNRGHPLRRGTVPGIMNTPTAQQIDGYENGDQGQLLPQPQPPNGPHYGFI